jgi:hypothetical protein
MLESSGRLRGESSANTDAGSETSFLSEATKCKLKLPVVSSDTLDVSLENFNKLFINEGAPYGFKQYHEIVKDTNLVLTSWVDESNVQPGQFSRELKFFKPVNLPGLASTRGVKVQRLVRFGDTGMFIHTTETVDKRICVTLLSHFTAVLFQGWSSAPPRD